MAGIAGRVVELLALNRTSDDMAGFLRPCTFRDGVEVVAMTATHTCIFTQVRFSSLPCSRCLSQVFFGSREGLEAEQWQQRHFWSGGGDGGDGISRAGQDYEHYHDYEDGGTPYECIVYSKRLLYVEIRPECGLELLH